MTGKDVVLKFSNVLLQTGFLLATPVIDHPQEELAKFGYRSEKKVEKFKILAVVWQFAETYCSNMAISGNVFYKQNLKIWQLWHSYSDSPLYE